MYNPLSINTYQTRSYKLYKTFVKKKYEVVRTNLKNKKQKVGKVGFRSKYVGLLRITSLTKFKS